MCLAVCEFGLSSSNHMDSASVQLSQSIHQKTDLAELFSKLGLGKYTDLFQQQEVRTPTTRCHQLNPLSKPTTGLPITQTYHLNLPSEPTN